jgi:hypothetical protein
MRAVKDLPAHKSAVPVSRCHGSAGRGGEHVAAVRRVCVVDRDENGNEEVADARETLVLAEEGPERAKTSSAGGNSVFGKRPRLV